MRDATYNGQSRYASSSKLVMSTHLICLPALQKYTADFRIIACDGVVVSNRLLLLEMYQIMFAFNLVCSWALSNDECGKEV